MFSTKYACQTFEQSFGCFDHFCFQESQNKWGSSRLSHLSPETARESIMNIDNRASLHHCNLQHINLSARASTITQKPKSMDLTSMIELTSACTRLALPGSTEGMLVVWPARPASIHRGSSKRNSKEVRVSASTDSG